MPLAIRRAAPADLEVIVEFNRRLAEESEGKTLDFAVVRPGVAAGLADPNKGIYFIAEENGIIVGQMMITLEWSDWRNGWFWWIQSVYVRTEARRRGVFRSLFQHVEELARQEPQVIGLRLYVERENRTAQDTYVSLGMEPTGYMVLEKYPL